MLRELPWSSCLDLKASAMRSLKPQMQVRVK
jgi:hypothetical protein